MSLFNPKLEPGERLVLRQPKAPDRLSLILGLLLVLLSWLGFYLFIDWISPNGIEPHMFVFTLLLPIHVLGQIVNARRWKVAVTDRRLLVNESAWFRTRQWEARLDEIEGVSMDHARYKVDFRAGGRTAECHPEGIDLREVKAATGHAQEATP